MKGKLILPIGGKGARKNRDISRAGFECSLQLACHFIFKVLCSDEGVEQISPSFPFLASNQPTPAAQVFIIIKSFPQAEK